MVDSQKIDGANSGKSMPTAPEARNSKCRARDRDKCPGASVAGPCHAAITREHDGLRTRAHTELVEYRREVIAHGLLADEERRGDGRVALAFGHELEDL